MKNKWLIAADVPGGVFFASAVETGCGFTDRRDEAAIFDHRDNQSHKLPYFDAIIGLMFPGVKCRIEVA